MDISFLDSMDQAPPDQNHSGNSSLGAWSELLSWEAATSSPAEASSGVFSVFTVHGSLPVLSFSPDLVFFPPPFVTWFSTVQKQLQF